MKKTLSVSFLALTVVASLVAQTTGEKKYSARVSQSRLLTVVRELVRLGPRTGGTPSGDRAAQYVARRFRESGYKPEVIEDPELLTSSNLKWSLKVEKPRSLRNLIRNEWLGGYSPSVRRSKATVVFVADASDLTKDELKGKAALLDDLSVRKSYQKVVEAGCSCILLISPKFDRAYSKWAMIIDLPRSRENSIPLFNLSFGNGERLKEALADSQRVVISYSTQTRIEQGKPKTVCAVLTGDSLAYYIVCAHGDSDSGGPGADDNASGVSGVLEIARNLKSLVQSRSIPKPKFSVRFAVWGTEIHSTEHYVKARKDKLGQILGVINLDEIGTGVTRDCLYFESNDVKHNERLLRTLEAIGEEYAGKKGYWAESTTNPSQGGTDSYVFLPGYLRHLKVADIKIPSVTVYTGAWNELKRLRQTEGWTSKAWKGHPDSVFIDYSAYYHSSLDLPEMTTEREPYNMVGAVKAVGIALLRLAW
jgi:hypothetical protein